ncbi:MAG: PilZ domain-containing protein [Deltaproteobacteria bacterium]|nr:PilZ domain-containing protein [Deltaproteobacteria bacterium]
MNMRAYVSEHRRAERHPTSAWFRLYTSLSSGGYTVKLENISSTGALVRTRFCPPEGEQVTFVALNEFYRPIFSGNAVIRWTNESDQSDFFGGHRDNGFGIQFAQPIDLSQVSLEG